MPFQMGIFVDESDDASPEGETRRALLEQISHGSESERAAALEQLGQLADESDGDEKSWTAFAMGLLHAGEIERALGLFQKLAEVFPANDRHRLNVATCYSQLQQFDLCRLTLKAIAAEAATDAARKVAADQLAGLEQFLGLSAREQKFRTMKMRGLEERIGAETAEADDYVQLGRLLLQQESAGAPGSENNTERAIEILEQGQSHFPQSVPILEMLAVVLLRIPGKEEKLEKTIARLESLAPDSKILAGIGATPDDEEREFSRRMRARAFELMGNCQSRDPDLVNASLRDLRQMVKMYGHVSEYRKTYAFGLMLAGRHEEAKQQAEILVQHADESHDLHFHLGQIFCGIGEEARGRHHLDLAMQFAQNEEERNDTRGVLAEIDKRGRQA